MTRVHLVVPEAVDDPARPSGGNTYDRHVAAGLRQLGWTVSRHLVAGDRWPDRDGTGLRSLAACLAGVPDASTVLLDGLLGSAADDVVLPHAARLRLVVLVHLPLGGHRERRVLEAAAAVVTTSGWTREVLLDASHLDPAVVRVATPGAPRAALVRGSEAGSRITCVAAVTPVKGHDLLAAALDTVRDLAWHCVCVGSLDLAPQHVTDVRAQVRAAGLADRVDFVGPLPEAELDRVYAASDLLVHASRLETYGMVVTEALARGIPVLSTAVGGIGEALGSTTAGPPGRLVPDGDPKALGAGLRSWLTDAAVRACWRAAARERRATLPRWDATARSVAAALTGERSPREGRLPNARPTTRGR